jgi:hypothetical protein
MPYTKLQRAKVTALLLAVLRTSHSLLSSSSSSQERQCKACLTLLQTVLSGLRMVLLMQHPP